MYQTPFSRMLCVIDGYEEIIATYRTNVSLVLNRNLYLSVQNQCFRLCTKPNLLHNLRYDADKAFKIITHMRIILLIQERMKCTKHSKEYYFDLIRSGIIGHYENDVFGLLYINIVLSEVEELIDDDEQFSPLHYF